MYEWISVQDSLPEYGGQVLVVKQTKTGVNQYTTCHYENHNYSAHGENRHPTWWVSVSGGHRLDTVTHWMLFKRL